MSLPSCRDESHWDTNRPGRLCVPMRMWSSRRCLAVGDAMTSDPLVLPVHLEVTEAISALNAHAVRRAPVLDAAGTLAGMVTLDDLLPAVAREWTLLPRS